MSIILDFSLTTRTSGIRMRMALMMLDLRRTARVDMRALHPQLDAVQLLLNAIELLHSAVLIAHRILEVLHDDFDIVLLPDLRDEDLDVPADQRLLLHLDDLGQQLIERLNADIDSLIEGEDFVEEVVFHSCAFIHWFRGKVPIGCFYGEMVLDYPVQLILFFRKVPIDGNLYAV